MTPFNLSQLPPILRGIISANLLVEHRFDEGSGTVVKDYSGNGNNGTYVGSPTLLPQGGFTSASGKYATGVTAAIATAQTIYVVCDIGADNASNYHAILGSSNGITSISL